MEKRLEMLESKIDRLDSRLDDIHITLVRNTDSLQEHMKRTDRLEKEFHPVRDHVKLVQFLVKCVGLAVSGAMAAHTLGVF